MNEQLRRPHLSMTTQAAEGMARRRWTVAEIQAMIAAGIILDDERFELIGGEVVPMAAKGNRHELVKMALQRSWFKVLPDDLSLITETTLYIDDDNFLEPDFVLWPRSVPLSALSVRNALLIVEVADKSLAYDLGRKAKLYAGLGLRELWVVDAVRLVTSLHTRPGPDGYGAKQKLAPKKPLIPSFAPSLEVELGKLRLD